MNYDQKQTLIIYSRWVERGFNPENTKEVGQFLSDIVNRIDNIPKPVNELQPGGQYIIEIEDNLAALNENEKSALADYLKNFARIILYQKNIQKYNGKSINEVPTTNRGLTTWRESEYEDSIQVAIAIPVCNALGCVWFSLSAFEYTSKLSWHYNNQTVSDATLTTRGEGNYYAIVGWSYKSDSTRAIDYYKPPYYVEAKSVGKFKRYAFSDYVTSQMDYARIELVGHSHGGGRTLKKEDSK